MLSLLLADIFPRQLNNRKQTSYVDKRIPCLDCQERMEGYKYASFIDKDEIIVPERNYMKNSFRHLLVRIPYLQYRKVVLFGLLVWGLNSHQQHRAYGEDTGCVSEQYSMHRGHSDNTTDILQAIGIVFSLECIQHPLGDLNLQL